MSEPNDSVGMPVVEPDLWRVVPSFPGLRVSRAGGVESRYVIRGGGPGSGKGSRVRILGDRWRPLKAQKLPSGYRYVHLSYRTPEGRRRRQILYVHFLVAEAFVGPRPAGLEVCHENGIRSDNRPENLRYGTKVENAADAARHGTRPIGSRHGIAKLSEGQVILIHDLIAERWPDTRIARRFKVCPQTISNIRHGRIWRHVTPRSAGGRPAPPPL